MAKKTKICKTCHKMKWLEEFAKNHYSKDGRRHTCRDCMSKVMKRAAHGGAADTLQVVNEALEKASATRPLDSAVRAFLKGLEEQGIVLRSLVVRDGGVCSVEWYESTNIDLEK